jgi:hypothetical protein
VEFDRNPLLWRAATVLVNTNLRIGTNNQVVIDIFEWGVHDYDDKDEEEDNDDDDDVMKMMITRWGIPRNY